MTTEENRIKEIKTEIYESEFKDHYHIYINGKYIGNLELSQVRQVIGNLDNGINQ